MTNRFIIWGVKYPTHSHHFIHLGFYNTLKKLGKNVVWLEDKKLSNALLQKDDLVLTANIACNNLYVSNEHFYCFHNLENTRLNDISPRRFINLQVMTSEAFKENLNDPKSIKLKGVSFFSPKENTLYQSWGTPLLKNEFLKPPKERSKSCEFFVGSIWDNEQEQGNIRAINEYKQYLQSKKIIFVHAKGLPEIASSMYVRNSALGSAVVGEWQASNGYTPCRLFKAVSLGVVGSINSPATQFQYHWAVCEETIQSTCDSLFKLTNQQRMELIDFQQKEILSETYESKLSNILAALDIAKNSN